MIMIEIPVDLKKVDKKSGDREIAEAVITCRKTAESLVIDKNVSVCYINYGVIIQKQILWRVNGE